MTSSAPRTHRIGGLGSTSCRSSMPEVLGRQRVQHPPVAGREARPGVGRGRRRPDNGHRRSGWTASIRRRCPALLGDERRLDVVRQQHLARGQRDRRARSPAASRATKPGLAQPPPDPAADGSSRVPVDAPVPPNPNGDTGFTRVSEAIWLRRVHQVLQHHPAAQAPADQMHRSQPQCADQRPPHRRSSRALRGWRPPVRDRCRRIRADPWRSAGTAPAGPASAAARTGWTTRCRARTAPEHRRRARRSRAR